MNCDRAWSGQAPPVLETERLRLRVHTEGDFERVAAMWADPVVVKYLGGQRLTGEESWWRLLRYAGHWNWLGFGYWVVEEKATGAFVGEVGFADYRRELESPARSAPEIGWVLGSAFHGKGYATEAARAVVAWGEERFGGGTTMCIIHPEHVASLRVAEKVGYRALHAATYRGQPVTVLVRGGAMAKYGSLVERWFEEVWYQGRRETVAELMREDTTLHDGPHETRGPAAFQQFLEGLREEFHEIRVTTHEVVAAGEMECARWSSTMRHAATGKEVHVTGISMVRVVNGVFVEGWQNWDKLGLLEQLADAPRTPLHIRAAGQ